MGYARSGSREPQSGAKGSGTKGGSGHGGVETLANGWAHVGPRDTRSTAGSEPGWASQHMEEGADEGEGSEREMGRTLCVHLLSAADSHPPLVEAARSGPGPARINGEVGNCAQCSVWGSRVGQYGQGGVVGHCCLVIGF